ncbi:unnamed protein product [Dovyalis caffra]|uniref:CCT domain-containing protein n=1 Tax=Dovyalis caffra TaxID=77055 RepID=A0AAV1QZM6_9ROSI|nr:unnamed protein product [Dovyalis caffra]
MANDFAERDHKVENEQKEIRGGIMGEGQELSEEDDESQISKDGQLVQVQTHGNGVMQRQQHRSQGPSVHWERFLPLRSLKVLLVENDDSTRHIVSALLKNCGYKVMSPHDSINIVFKCLSKGAAEFLVKPIRKNELRNLWQHVWRKCHSASGSGIESAVQTQKSTQSKSAEESDNSNDEDGYGSIGLNARDGSGTQTSWTKEAVEVDSPKPVSPWDQVVDPPDRTCAQVIHSKPEEGDNNWVPVAATTKRGEQDDEVENIAMGKEFAMGVPRIPNLQLKHPSKKVPTKKAGNNGEKFPEIKSKQDGGQIEKGQLELNREKHKAELRNQGNDKNGVIINDTNPQIESVVDIPNGLSSCKKNEAIYETKEMPSLELSLKRLRDIGDTGTSYHDRNVLRHSDLSAFSRYNSASAANQAPTGNVGSCSPLDNSSEAEKTESMQNLQSNSNSTPPNQHSNGSSSNNDMGSTNNNAFTKPLVISDKPAPKSTVKWLYPSSAFQPVKNDHAPLPQSIQDKSDAAISNAISIQSRGKNQQVQVQHHYHHYHHYHQHVHNSSQLQKQANHDDLYLQNMAAAAPQHGSFNMLSTPLEGNAGNYISNGRVSGSDHGSIDQNRSSTALNPRGINMKNNNGAAGEGGTPGASSVIGSRAGVGQNRFALREAASIKFRQKRKERCFEKKVRYQSRKKLAEQRPRIRGQFVRQVAHEHKDKDDDARS